MFTPDFDNEIDPVEDDSPKKPEFLIEVTLPDAKAQQDLMQSLERRGLQCWSLTQEA